MAFTSVNPSKDLSSACQQPNSVAPNPDAKPKEASTFEVPLTGNCKRESQEMLPSCPPVNHSSEMEDQDVLFSNRAKLYQFDRPTSQWKERAVGEMKVFQHKRKKISRVVMWSSVNKCCANHWITRNLQLRQIKNRFDSWAWRTLDFSEEKSMVLDLAVRFQLKETALAFKNVFENVQSTVEVCHLPEARLNCSGVNGKSDPNVNNLGDLSEIDQVAIQGKPCRRVFDLISLVFHIAPFMM
uniref:RanBD1 domain-containing protein n=1 Tax=Callorhinchus milii TaxID=7868 RepID=A0A4W3GNH3_CALMI